MTFLGKREAGPAALVALADLAEATRAAARVIAAEAARAELSRAATVAVVLAALAVQAEALATEAADPAMLGSGRKAALAPAVEVVLATEVALAAVEASEADPAIAEAESALAEALATETIPPEAEEPRLIGATTPGAAASAEKAICWARGQMEPVPVLAESAMNLPATQGPVAESELTRFLRSIGDDWTATSTIRAR